ncbi:MAG TPA: acetate uptake transporter [Chitinophagaceae bacterium]|nr:acetate uptake transporter [Chitinophagaceae bacterium]
MEPHSDIIIREPAANPSPLGLLGFGMTTVLLNLSNTGIFPMNAMILAMGICFGGLAQIMAGILEFRKNNTFGLTAFISYGFFWLSLVALIILPKLGWGEAVNPAGMASYLICWGVFTAILWVVSFRISVAVQVVFATLTLLFALLAGAELTGRSIIRETAGVEGIVCGCSAIYAGSATLLNEVWGKTILPMGHYRIRGNS